MEPLGLKIKKALSRLNQTDNYLFRKPEREWNYDDLSLVKSFLRTARVEEDNTMKELQKVQEFFSKPLDEKKETNINTAKRQLDALGVKYELGNKFKPFKTIYKPTGKSDKFYDTFNDIIDLFNLGNAVESSMNEVSAEYSRKNKRPIKVGDIVGNTVQGFDFKVLGIQNDKMKVMNIVTGKEFMTDIDNMHLLSVDETINDPRIDNPKFGPAPKQFVSLRAKLGDESLLDKIQMINVNVLRDLLDELDSYNLEEDKNSTYNEYSEVGYKKVGESELTEAYVPSNIKEFAKRKGATSLVNKVADWTERVGKRINGGVAIGKNYNTLVLDMGYQTADIYIDLEDETIELYNQPANSFSEFKEVFMDQMTADEIEKDENQFRREQGLEEMMSLDDQAKAYFLEKFKKGKINSLPDNPTAAFLNQMMKGKIDIATFGKYSTKRVDPYDDQVSMRNAISGLEEGMGGQLDEKYFIEVSVRDARKAIDIFNDQYSKADIEMYGSNVYASNKISGIYDLYYELTNQGIEILDYNIDESDDLEEVTNEFSPLSYAMKIIKGEKIEDVMEESGLRFVELKSLIDKIQKGLVPSMNEEQYGRSKLQKGFEDAISKETFSKLKGKKVGYFGNTYKVIDSDEYIITLQDDDGDIKTVNLNQFIQKGIIPEMKKRIQETIKLGEGMIEEELCAKGKAYRKRRLAAGEKSSAYLSGRAVKVCKGQMSGLKKKK